MFVLLSFGISLIQIYDHIEEYPNEYFRLGKKIDIFINEIMSGRHCYK